MVFGNLSIRACGLALGCALCILNGGFAAAPAREDTVILVNTNARASEEVGKLYAEARGIPPRYVCRIGCSDKTSIDRKSYNEEIRDPVLAFLEKDDLFRKVRFLAACYGVPLKIQGDKTQEKKPPAGADMSDQEKDKKGEDEKDERREIGGSHSSVDSELALVLWKEYTLNGVVHNPYYGQDAPISETFLPGLILVTRLDGPTPDVAMDLVKRALEGERLGLHGRGYFDIRGIDSGGYADGDRWIRWSWKHCMKAGFPCEIDREGSLFSQDYPMEDTAFYFGWYSQSVQGPFRNKDFRFRPGAVAYHLVSNSADSLRGGTWAGAFLNERAAVTMGAVHEPFLGGTIHCDVFLDRLLKGYTFAEACYMATPLISWQMTFVGDPLYAPFKPELLKKQQEEADKADPDTRCLAAIETINRLCMAKNKTDALQLIRSKFSQFQGTRFVIQLLGVLRAAGAFDEALAFSKEVDAGKLSKQLGGAYQFELAQVFNETAATETALKTIDGIVEKFPAHPLAEQALLLAIRKSREDKMDTRLKTYWQQLSALAKTPSWQDVAKSELWIRDNSLRHNRRVLNAKRARGEIKLDGNTDEKDWSKAESSSGFTLEAKDPVDEKSASSVKALYGKDTLYLLIECRHPAMESVKIDPTVPRGQIWQHESIEIFLSPVRDYTRYVQLLTNPAGVMADNPFGQDIEKNGWKVAVQRTSAGWTAEIAVPFLSLKAASPSPGTVWGVNFGRNSEGKGSLWAPIAGSSHQPAQFGYLRFE